MRIEPLFLLSGRSLPIRGLLGLVNIDEKLPTNSGEALSRSDARAVGVWVSFLGPKVRNFFKRF